MKTPLPHAIFMSMLSLTLGLPLSASASSTGTTLDGVRVNPGAVKSNQPLRLLSVDTASMDGERVELQFNTDDLDLGRLIAESKALRDLRVTQENAKDEAKGRKEKKPEFKFEVSKNMAMGLDEVERLARFVIERRQLSGQDDLESKMALVHMREILESFNANFLSPIPEKLNIFSVASNQFADVGDKAGGTAWNIKATSGDLSRVNPPNSTFWRDPGDISKKETYFGFGRKALPVFPNEKTLSDACTYEGPKEGYGTHGGIVVACDGKIWKVKFGNETYTEQFTSRIVDALGYNATPVEHADGLAVKYDRRIISQFNNRKSMPTKVIVTALELIHFNKDNQSYRDPFKEMIAGAILKDGSRLGGEQLREHLLKNTAPEAERSDDSYKATDSKSDGVAQLILHQASVEPKPEKGSYNIGAWSWDTEDHANRRELRGFAIFAAWINNYDMRWDNTRLRIIENADGSRELNHVLSDLGSGFGAAVGQIKHTSGQPNDFPWTMMKTGGSWPLLGKITGQRPFVIPEFISLLPNESFRATNLDDARWMARMIGQLTEEQIKAALITTGRDSAGVKLYLEKLIARRDNMIQVLKLENEIKLLRPNGVNTELNYDPKVEGPVSIVVDGKAVVAPVDDKVIVGGVVK